MSTSEKQTRGRPRQFDETSALIAATRVFWRYGYAGSSISLPLKEMGINRASMYTTFGNKEALFKKVIKRYEEEMESYMLKALDRLSGRGVAEHLLKEHDRSENGSRRSTGQYGGRAFLRFWAWRHFAAGVHSRAWRLLARAAGLTH